ncbi:PREDICTED: tachykinins [Nicrophorus vespilloides]|uniref:Tachykinins n=1 Tax=Nicrophorus vespilloides TaxID=110193 RepID=A0ABM1MM99_NICVS|nr:PREDICTED: tachykinins [Nicrophorus vespilloides]
MRVPNISIVLATVWCLVSTAAEEQKRGPSGFTGVRGKKSFEDEDFEMRDIEDKRAPSGFLGMRGKKPFEGWTSLDYPEVGIKRAPSGFQGMRGKKGLDYVEVLEKRAPSGFLGMRGKKEYDDMFEKRAPSGFLGMRGKKDLETVLLPEESKRAPNGFFGMRGKKPSRSAGFFGMRGKKYPYEFRGKFVGVRGKKMSNEAVPPPEYYEEFGKLGQGLDINQLMLLLTENDGYNLAKETGQDY